MFSNFLDKWTTLYGHFLVYIAIIFTSFVFLYVQQRISLHLSRKKLTAEHNCMPLVSRNYRNVWLLGLDVMVDNFRQANAGRLLESVRERFQSRGQTHYQRILSFTSIATVDKENIKAILSDNFHDFVIGDRINTLGTLLGYGIFTTDGMKWHTSRQLIKPNFDRKQLAHLETFERAYQNFLRHIPDKSDTVIDLQELFFMYTIDTATQFLFGRSVDTLKRNLPVSGVNSFGKGRVHDSELNEQIDASLSLCQNDEKTGNSDCMGKGLHMPWTNVTKWIKEWYSSNVENIDFATAFNIAQQACAVRIRLATLGPLYYTPKTIRATRDCHRFVDQFVNQAIEYRKELAHDTLLADANGNENKVSDENDRKNSMNTTEAYVFLHELAKSTQDRVRLRSELLNILLAGRDTTASLLSNFFHVLARRHDIWKKLKEEVEPLNGEPPTLDQIKSLTYLRYCLQESLRYHPVVPLNGRRAIHDTVLPHGGGEDGKSPILVKRGTRIFYSTYALHRRKEYYGEDADDFRPERWITLRQGWHYIPFNAGPRICVGQQYALIEASYVCIRILQTFDRIEPRDDQPWTEALTLTLCSKYGTKVAMYRE